MVISFDPELVKKQNELPIENVQLAQDLGFAGIDSLHGKEMHTFYRG